MCERQVAIRNADNRCVAEERVSVLFVSVTSEEVGKIQGYPSTLSCFYDSFQATKLRRFGLLGVLGLLSSDTGSLAFLAGTLGSEDARSTGDGELSNI